LKIKIAFSAFVKWHRMTLFRSAARALGIPKLLSLPARLTNWCLRRRYRLERPTKASVCLDGSRFTFRVGSEKEFMMVMALARDAHLLRVVRRHLQTGNAVWDIGANIGTYTMVFSTAVGDHGQVYAFDPIPACVERIRSNAQENQRQNVTVFPIALGNRNDTARMAVADEPSVGSHQLIENDCEGESASSVLEVRMASGDVWRQEHHLQPPAAIKVDVEGYEREVLQGLQQTLSAPECMVVLCEIHFHLLEERGFRRAPAEIADYLSSLGFCDQSWPDKSHLLAVKPQGN
jgi:FkbM family methyltransferase